jgi:hypothetical protein
MAGKNNGGQMMTELLWAIVLVAGLAVFLTRLYEAAHTQTEKARWEIQTQPGR